jgi:hypothetical protein
MDAAFAALNHWVRDRVTAPTASLITVTPGPPPQILRDRLCSALGGIRTPALDTPISTLQGTGNTGESRLCVLYGTRAPFSAEQLRTLYPLHSDYVSAVHGSAQDALRSGFLRRADVREIQQNAVESVVSTPAG